MTSKEWAEFGISGSVVEEKNKDVRSLVLRHMLHDCDRGDCLKHGFCSCNFPKEARARAVYEHNGGYLEYFPRRVPGHVIVGEKDTVEDGIVYTTTYVKPGMRRDVDTRVVMYHGRTLLAWEGHANLVPVADEHSAEYALKAYIYKGPDYAAALRVGEETHVAYTRELELAEKFRVLQSSEVCSHFLGFPRFDARGIGAKARAFVLKTGLIAGAAQEGEDGCLELVNCRQLEKNLDGARLWVNVEVLVYLAACAAVPFVDWMSTHVVRSCALETSDICDLASKKVVHVSVGTHDAEYYVCSLRQEQVFTINPVGGQGEDAAYKRVLRRLLYHKPMRGVGGEVQVCNACGVVVGACAIEDVGSMEKVLPRLAPSADEYFGEIFSTQRAGVRRKKQSRGIFLDYVAVNGSEGAREVLQKYRMAFFNKKWGAKERAVALAEEGLSRGMSRKQIEELCEEILDEECWADILDKREQAIRKEAKSEYLARLAELEKNPKQKKFFRRLQIAAQRWWKPEGEHVDPERSRERFVFVLLGRAGRGKTWILKTLMFWRLAGVLAKRGLGLTLL